MASPGSQTQPTWIPYETIKDCSQGFCSIYCPQWCYIIFPPPPPAALSSPSSDDASPSSAAAATLSPLVIAIIGILAGAFLLFAYYAVISKYCTSIDALRRRLRGGGEAPLGGDPAPGGPWYVPSAGGGLDEGVIKSIGQFRYRSCGEGPLEEGGGDCSVCLGEFRDGEGLRLLPKCGHAFHVACIDHWLRSHANCPLCRAAVVSPSAASSAVPPSPPPTATPEQQPEIPQHAVAADGGVERGSSAGEASQPGGLERAAPVPKSGALNRGDIHIVLEFGDGGGGGAQPIRRSFSMDASFLSRVCVADVLELGIETAVDREDMGSTSRGCGTGQDAGKDGGDRAPRRPHPGPGAIKRSFSSGRFCFTRQGKGSHDGILPI